MAFFFEIRETLEVHRISSQKTALSYGEMFATVNKIFNLPVSNTMIKNDNHSMTKE